MELFINRGKILPQKLHDFEKYSHNKLCVIFDIFNMTNTPIFAIKAVTALYSPWTFWDMNYFTSSFGENLKPHYFGHSWGHDAPRNKCLDSLEIYTDRAVEKLQNCCWGCFQSREIVKTKVGHSIETHCIWQYLIKISVISHQHLNIIWKYLRSIIAISHYYIYIIAALFCYFLFNPSLRLHKPCPCCPIYHL